MRMVYYQKINITKMTKIKCDKCNERGYIDDTEIKGAASSCECGWAIEQSQKKFDAMFGNPVREIDLLIYAAKRIKEKRYLETN